MSTQTLAPAQSACALLAKAKQESVESGEVVKLILAGTRRIDSWLVEHRIVPKLQQENATTLHFTLTARGGERRQGALLPLPDGSAFARSTSGRWSPLEPLEALSAIQYIGYRYAFENGWSREFEAMVQTAERPPRPVIPFEVANIWTEITGSRPAGFASGPLDAAQALGLELIGRVFNSQGRLGL